MVAAEQTGEPALMRVHPPALVRRTFRSEEHAEDQEEIACPGCGFDRAELVFFTEDWLMGKPGRYRLVRCQHCSLVHLNPRPTAAALGPHYPDDYFCYTNFEGEHWLLHRLGARMQKDLSQRRLSFIERATGRLARGTRVVDVGCGRGDLLDCFKRQRDCDVIGVDFNDKVAETVRSALGIEVVSGTLHNARFEAERFDLVTMAEYLEHEPDPRAVLEEAHRLLRPGGHIAIEVPDVSGPPSRLFRSRWWQVDSPRHLVLFSPTTLASMLESTGFELVEVRRFGRVGSMGYSLLQLFGWRYAGSNHLLYLLVATLLSLPFAPFLPLLPDFMFVVARRK